MGSQGEYSQVPLHSNYTSDNWTTSKNGHGQDSKFSPVDLTLINGAKLSVDDVLSNESHLYPSDSLPEKLDDVNIPHTYDEETNRFSDIWKNIYTKILGKQIDKPIMRQQWNKEIEFVLACIGNAVGLGNLWRFPYLCYQSGGGAFLIPYFLMLILCGIPLLYMEVAVGQTTRLGPVGALRHLCPFFQGAGLATVVLSFLLCTYYNVIMSWAFYFLVASCAPSLPWGSCNNTWNTDNCWDAEGLTNATRPNNSVSPSEEFFERQVLQQSSGLEEPGGVIWYLALILLLCWVLVYLCLWKGTKWAGKVVYFTATFPYVVIIALIARGVTLPGADKGIDFFIKPDWSLLKDPMVWVNAAAQNFNSIGIAFGSMIAFSSYSKRDSKIFRDVLAICLVNAVTSIMAGFAVFSILGYIAHTQGQLVKDVVTAGPGLVMIVYPAAFVTMGAPWGQIFSFFFFFMIMCLAIDSQFASVEVVITSIEDSFGRPLMRVLKRREVLVLLVCIVAYFLGFPVITNGGIYYFNIIDKYSSGISLMLIAFFEVAAVAWFYGAKQLADKVQLMTGRRPYMYFVVCWYGISPALILAIMVFNWVDYTPVTYGSYRYPAWGEGLGWGIASLSLVCLPLGMIKGVLESSGNNFLQKFLTSIRPLPDDVDTSNEKPISMDVNHPGYTESGVVAPTYMHDDQMNRL